MANSHLPNIVLFHHHFSSSISSAETKSTVLDKTWAMHRSSEHSSAVSSWELLFLLHLLFKTRVIIVHHNLSSMVVARGKWGMVVEVIFRRLKRIGSSVVQKCCLSHRPTIRRWWLSACMLSLASFLFCAYYITHVQLNRWGFLSFSFFPPSHSYKIFIQIGPINMIEIWRSFWKNDSR